jgi:hypothetical protein
MVGPLPVVKDNVSGLANLQVDINSTELLSGKVWEKGCCCTGHTVPRYPRHYVSICLRASASCPYLTQSIQPCGGITRDQENEGTKQQKRRTIQLVEKIPEAFLAPAETEQIHKQIRTRFRISKTQARALSVQKRWKKTYVRKSRDAKWETPDHSRPR